MRYLLLCFCLSLYACGTPDVDSRTRDIADRYAPDSRTDRVEVRLANDTLAGYTTVRAAYRELSDLAQSEGLTNTIELLPSKRLGSERIGLIKVSVANLRSRPGHSQELATQALLGTPVALLDERDGWFLVRTPDRYLAWLEPGAFMPG